MNVGGYIHPSAALPAGKWHVWINKRMAGERHGHAMGMAWARHAMFESAFSPADRRTTTPRLSIVCTTVTRCEVLKF
jgi:hypothetical protein